MALTGPTAPILLPSGQTTAAGEPLTTPGAAPSIAPTEARALTGWLHMTLGALALVLGSLWTLQGLDVVTGSFMSDVIFWSFIGPVVAIGGLTLIVKGVRDRTRSKNPTT